MKEYWKGSEDYHLFLFYLFRSTLGALLFSLFHRASYTSIPDFFLVLFFLISSFYWSLFVDLLIGDDCVV